MATVKIFNDPIYGLVSLPFELLYDLIDHPYFQRLRRISQLGLTNYVYPGAVHSRFNHAIGVVYLCTDLVTSLRLKGVDISDEEYEACCIAALLHDLGHGPFSHALEEEIVPLHHEELTLMLMRVLNNQMGGRLALSMKILKGEYERPFLTQLLKSQLDIDRMDYLNRDSFYTGVAEGIIGYQRIIKMMNVHDEHLVVEEKGIYSIEKFLVSRYLMYSQVYLHKTAISAEQMLLAFFRHLKALSLIGKFKIHNPHFSLLFDLIPGQPITEKHLEAYINLDDTDVYSLLKECATSEDYLLKYLSDAILNRKLFRAVLKKSPFSSDFLSSIRLKIEQSLRLDKDLARRIVLFGEETNRFYLSENEIKIKTKDKGEIIPFSALARFKLLSDTSTIYFVCFPKIF